MLLLHRYPRVALAITVAAGTMYCSGGDNLTVPPGPGSLQIRTTTSGADQDADGYFVQLDGGPAQSIGVAATLTTENVAPGSHAVQLLGLAENCTTSGDNPQTVSVSSEETVTVDFAVACTATTGTLTITAATSGPSPDVDGYTLFIDGADRGPLAPNATATINALAPGTHLVGLSGLAGNCQVQGDNVRQVTITAGAQAAVTYTIACVAPPAGAGTLRLTATTTGPDGDGDGYTFKVDGGAAQPIGMNAQTTLTNLAAGSHTVELGGIAANCAIGGTNPRAVTITSGATTDVNFTLTCSATTGTVRVTVTTSGSPGDPDGYVAKLGNADPGLPVGSNANVSFPGVAAGTHTVALSGLAANCTVTGGPSRSVVVEAGVTSEVAFTVVCTPPTVSNRLAIISGDQQSGPVGTTLTAPLVVRVTDGAGAAVPNVVITWSVTGGGSVSPATTTTATDGQASVTRTLGGTAGEQKTVATAEGLAGSPVTFTHAATGPNTTGLGRWEPLFNTPVVGVHTHLLITGKVLIWGDEGDAQLWTPGGGFTAVPKTHRIYCSAHTFLPDGRLLVVGGTSTGTLGLRLSAIFNPSSGSWSAAASMAQGRYYATTTTLPSGDILAVSGHDTTKAVVTIPEVGNGNAWRRLTSAPLSIPDPYYPAMFVAPNGKVFMAGFPQMTQYLDVGGTGAWTPVGNRIVADRKLGSAVMYAPGKILYAGGGDPPTATAEVIDLNQASPSWRSVGRMAFARRQMNATLLADGTVLVTGGTSSPGFNNQAGSVRSAELWNPATESWRTLAAESRDRTYHGTSLLLPTGQVLSSGSGEGGGIPYARSDFTGQIFNPPYLFNADGTPAVRPRIGSAPARLSYGQSFTVETPDAASITRGTLIRLSSVTHAFNMSQLNYPLTFSAAGATTLGTTAPPSGNLAPPGPYMLFLIDASGTPSVARMVMVGP